MLQIGWILAASLIFIVPVLVLIRLTRNFAARERLPITVTWINDLSIDRYRPMLRLLNPEDVRRLRAQPGFTWRMANKFRSQRCQLFREYLHSLDADFNRVHMALKVIMVQSKYDRPDLANILVHSKLTFAFRMMIVESQLVCYRYGIGAADFTDIIELFDALRLELRTLVRAESLAGTGL